MEVLTRQAILERMRGPIAEQLGVDPEAIVEGKIFVGQGDDAFNADSLDAVEIVMKIEDEFELTIPDEEAEGLTSVSLALDYVEQALAMKADEPDVTADATPKPAEMPRTPDPSGAPSDRNN